MFADGASEPVAGRRGLDAAGLTPEAADRFLAARRAAGYTCSCRRRRWRRCWASCAGWAWSRRRCAVPRPTPAEALLDRYRRYLVTERGPGRRDARGYADKVRPFLAGRGGSRRARPGGLTAAEVTAFVLAELPGHAQGHGEADGDRAAVAAGLPARRGR